MELKIEKKILIFFGILIILSGIYLITVFNPEDVKIFPPCIFYKLTGLYCPGCGMTRATHALFNGEIMKAIDYNPLFFSFSPLFIYMAAVQIKSIITTGKTRAIRLPYWLTVIVVIAVFAFWILRNIPYSPFTYLAP